MRFVYNVVSNWWSCRIFFFGSCWCSEMQITDKIYSTMFCLFNFCVHGFVFWWFLRLLRAFRVSTNFFIGWCFPLIHMAWTSSHSRCVLPGIICDLASYMSIPTCSNFLVSSCSRNKQWRPQLDYPTTTQDMFFHFLWLSMDFRDRNIQNYFRCFFPTKGVYYDWIFQFRWIQPIIDTCFRQTWTTLGALGWP